MKIFSFVAQKNVKSRAFTLSELLIALGIIGILVAILAPILFRSLPNQDVLMAKRAFNATQLAVSNMINNDSCYPGKASELNEADRRIGLDDGQGYEKCKSWGTSKGDNAGKKFWTLLTEELDVSGNVSDSGNRVTFSTKDGMYWTISKLNNFTTTKNDPESYVLVQVDVSGKGDGVDCGQFRDYACPTNNKEFDTFGMRVFANGRIQVLDCWAVDAVSVGKNISDSELATTGDNCAGFRQDLALPEKDSMADLKKEDDACKTRTTPPDSHTDPCCDSTLHPGSPWVTKAACDVCYPANNSKVDITCCTKWFTNSDFGVSSDYARTLCCPNYDFAHSPLGYEKCGTDASSDEISSGGGGNVPPHTDDEDKPCPGIKIPEIGCVYLAGKINTYVTGADKEKYDPDGSCSKSFQGAAKKACDDLGMELIDKAALEKLFNVRSQYPSIDNFIKTQGPFIIEKFESDDTEIANCYAYMTSGFSVITLSEPFCGSYRWCPSSHSAGLVCVSK